MQARTAWSFLLPTLVVLLLVAGYPLYQTLVLSFTNANILNPGVSPEGVGFANYAYLFTDATWWRAVLNTVIFTVSSVGVELVVGLIIALVVNAEFRGRGLVRTAMLIPWAIPTVVAAQMWRWMYNDIYGVINDFFLRIGILDAPVAWLADPSVTLGAVIAVDVWKTTPFMALLLLAGLQSIPKELYEAARVDGANAWRQFWSVTWPLLLPAALVALIFRTLDALRVFDIIYVMTGSQIATISMSVYARQQLVDFGDLGYGSAVSMVIFLIIGLFTVVYLMNLRMETD